MELGSGVLFGGGVDGAVRFAACAGCGEGDVARYMRRSAPSFLSKGLERRRLEPGGRGEGVRGMRGGELAIRVGPVWPLTPWKESVGRSLSSDSESREGECWSSGTVEVWLAKERPLG